MNRTPQRPSRIRFALRCMIFLAGLSGLMMIPMPGINADEPGPSQQSLIMEAEQAYRDGDYEESIGAFEKLVMQVPEDPVVLFNLGTVYMQAGKKGRAIWRYLQGFQVSPRDKQIRYHLQNISPDLFDQMALTPIPPLNWLYESMTVNEWGWLMTVFGSLLLLSGILYFILPRDHWIRSKGRGFILFLGVMVMIIYPFGLARYYYGEVISQGVVVEEDTVARTGPDENSVETFALSVGTIVRIEEVLRDKKWLKISFAGGRVGFVPRPTVERL
jgi:hypothetical protein